MMSNIKTTISEYISSELFKGTTFINGLFYFLGKIPFIGKFIPVGMIYADYSLKKVFTYIKFAISMVIKLVFTLVPFFISVILTRTIFESVEVSSLGIWLVLFAFWWPIFSSFFSLPDKKDILFLLNFRINKTSYIKRNNLLILAADFIIVSIALIIVSFLNDFPIIMTTLYSGSLYILFNLLWLRVDLSLTIQKRPWIKKMVVLVVLFATSIGYIFTLLVPMLNFAISKPFIMFGFTLINYAISFYLFKSYWYYKHFTLAVNKKVRTSLYALEADDTELKNKTANFTEGVGLTEKMTVEEDTSLDSLSGSAYLNALFFSRFKKGLKRGLVIKIATISVIGLTIIVITQLLSFKSDINELQTIMYRLVPSLFFILYLSSVGKSVVQSLFMNCDISMLTYPFYRTKEAIISGFLVRFKKILFYNSLVNAVLLFWLILFNVIVVGIQSIPLIGLSLLVIISLTLLFSFHELFIYYLLQPFTSDFEVVNPLYKLVNGLFYVFAYVNLQLKTTGLYYALGLSIVSLLYVGIGFVVILKLAPKTFKLKN